MDRNKTKTNDFREVEFSNQNGTGIFIKIPDKYSEKDISINKDWLQLKTEKGHNAIPLKSDNMKFIGFSHSLKNHVIDKFFNSEKEYFNLLEKHEIYYNYSVWNS